MNANWAAENLQTIRTLMERSAVYRRALAPVSMVTGGIGLVAGGAGWMSGLSAPRAFILYWFAVACVALAGAFVVVRRQAIRDQEGFWSPPTRRVAAGMLPGLYIGLVAGLLLVFVGGDSDTAWVLVPVWMALYGSALLAAGFFMQRGIRLFGWIFIATGTLLLGWLAASGAHPEFRFAHIVMGLVFGGLHLAYGIYLHFTEPKNAS
jgi:hypothetical protein